MTILNLNGIWTMTDGDGVSLQGTIPGSVYSFLLDAGRMEDPYWRDNELSALALMEKDYTFSRTFSVEKAYTGLSHQILRFDGIDTLADVYLNGTLLGSTDNMHSWWEFDVKGLLREGENDLQVAIHSPTRYIADKDKEYHLGGSYEAMKGFPHLRKAHCMFGWDWGPRLPDQGIWKDVQLLGWDASRITDVKIRQEHFLSDGAPAMGAPIHGAEAHEGKVQVTLTVEAEQSGDLPVEIVLCAPDGKEYKLENGTAFMVPEAQLWWPNGLGEQPLYTVTVRLSDGTETADETSRRIGLRTVTMNRTPDEWGETFAEEVNGRTYFSMEAD